MLLIMRTIVNGDKMEAHKWKKTLGQRVQLCCKVEGRVEGWYMIYMANAFEVRSECLQTVRPKSLESILYI